MKCLKNKIPVEQFMAMYGQSLGIQPLEHKEKEAMKEALKEAQKEGQRPVLEPPQGSPQPPSPPPPHEPREEKHREPIPPKPLPPNAEKYRTIIAGIEGQAKTVLTDANIAPVIECPIGEMIDRIKSSDGIHAVVFDGVISQRLLDVSHERGVKFIVASRVGNVGKFPSDVTIVLRKDLERK